MKKLLVGVCLCVSPFVLAQTSDKWPSSAQSVMQYAAAVKAGEFSAVTVISNERILSFDAAGRLTDTYRSTYRIERADELGSWANTGSRYEPWHQSKPEINARVIAPDGSVTPLDPKTLTDAPAGNDQQDIYSDARRVDAPLPALSKGSIVQEEIIVKDTEPRFAAGTVERVWFSRSVPVESTTVTLIHPLSLVLRYTSYLLPDLKIEKSTSGNVETIIFRNSRIDPDDSDLENAPAGEPVYPQLAIATGSSWNGVAAAYAKATELKIRPADVQGLVTDAERKLPRDERIARLVDRLHKQVRYTGIEFGESSLIPQDPAETLKRHFGDCKDKATLLVTMLRAANVPAKLALLNAEAIQANADLPGMSFDHAIVYVPAAGGGNEYWIDATSPFSAIGTLPYADYGRMALIVDEKTSGLTATPELRSADNIHTEFRRFELAEDGPSRVVEINQNSGPWDASARNSAFTRNKNTRDGYQRYVRETYLSEKLGKLDFGDPTDMTKPFTVSVEALKAPRGSTDFQNAVVAILPFDISDGLPNALRYEQDKEKKAKTRRVDFQFYPSTTVWRYEIHPPLGYKIGVLPPDSERAIASAKLTQKYVAMKDGSVAATLTFDTGKGRLSPAEAAQLRTALAELRNAAAILITFDSEPLSLINAGKVKEGLSQYQKIAAAHPKEALHRMQLASAYLGLGLGQRARDVAKQALELEPKSAKAHLVYAQILEHDLIGRRFGKGFDYEAAIAEYRAAKALDPEDKDLRTNLAILLEHNPEGRQYLIGSRLPDALAEWEELKKVDEDYARKYEDNVLFDLWRLDRLDELQKRIRTLPDTETRRQLFLASLALSESPQAAIDKARSLAGDIAGRMRLLTGVGGQLLVRHRFKQATAIYRAIASESDSAAPLLTLADMLEHAKPLEEMVSSASGAARAMLDVSRDFMDPLTPDAKLSNWYSNKLSLVLDRKHFDDLVKYERRKALSLKANGMDPQIILELGFGAIRLNVDGDEKIGFRVSSYSSQSEGSRNFFVIENGAWKVVSDDKRPSLLGSVVLDALERGDLPAARKWLDWARDESKPGGSVDDPLSGNVFTRFWTKGQQGDADAIRLAAIALVRNSDYVRLNADKVTAILTKAKGADSPKVLLLRAEVAEKAQRWAELHELGSQLLKQYPESEIAVRFVSYAAIRLKNFDEAEEVLKPFRERDPDDSWVVRQVASIYEHRRDYDGAQRILEPLVENGKATASDLNSYAWLSLFSKAGVDRRALEVGQRGLNLNKKGFGIMHTVACQYAEVGRGREAYKLLLEAMDAADMTEPESEVWYALARIAESYGEADAALAMYQRVEGDDEGLYFPTATIVLAQRHLDAINASQRVPANGSAKAASH